MTQTTQTAAFPNIFKAIKAEQAKRMQEFISSVNEEKSISVLTNPYNYFGGLIPKSKKGYLWTLEGLREYLIARKLKANEKALNDKLAHLQAVADAEQLESISISVEWKKSRMWGSNPTADARVCGKMYGQNYIGTASGCGYDKESAAIAEALNQSLPLLKALYALKETAPDAKNHDLFGYGSGYGILPHFEGGVGVSCYPKIFEKIGFKWERVATGKTFDAYAVKAA